MKRRELAISPMERILKKKAGKMRVSEGAAEALAEVLEEIGTKIAVEAADYAMHAARRTVMRPDVEVATTKVLGGRLD